MQPYSTYTGLPTEGPASLGSRGAGAKKKSKILKLNFFLLFNQEMRKGKITLNFKERKYELLHTAKKTVKEMKNLQVI